MIHMSKNTLKPVLHALLAAVLYGMNIPFAKLLTREIDPLYLASFLYLGAGIGMSFLTIFDGKGSRATTEARLSKSDGLNIAWMIILDIAAPIFLMLGLTMTNASTVSLLGNFEIVATSVIALIFFREAIGRRVWIAIILVTLSCMILTIEGFVNFQLSSGAILVLLACICWGFENNFTRSLSGKDPRQIVVIKGLGSGFGALLIAIGWGTPFLPFLPVFFAMILGFFAYGMSITLYVMAQRQLGAARTSAYYAAAPFIGILLSWLVLRESVSSTFIGALVIMVAGVFLIVSEKHTHEHQHVCIEHDHGHMHEDGHHDHEHEDSISLVRNHSHYHKHEEQTHQHTHLPDSHHRHGHNQG